MKPILNTTLTFLQESRLKFKSWLSYTWPEAISSIEISYKKVRDGYPLRLWKATTEIDAEPDAVMNRIVHERYGMEHIRIKVALVCVRIGVLGMVPSVICIGVFSKSWNRKLHENNHQYVQSDIGIKIYM